MSITNIYFGSPVNDHWSLLYVLDQNKQPINYIAVRSEFWTKEAEKDFLKLIKTHKVIGLSSYQCFPKFINNPYENRGPTSEADSFINKYGNLVILWCHCFKNIYGYSIIR